MNRFPAHYHEGAEQPLRCFDCDNRLTETESGHYWDAHPHGEREPRCFDCLAQIDPDDMDITVSRSEMIFRVVMAVFFVTIFVLLCILKR